MLRRLQQELVCVSSSEGIHVAQATFPIKGRGQGQHINAVCTCCTISHQNMPSRKCTTHIQKQFVICSVLPKENTFPEPTQSHPHTDSHRFAMGVAAY